MRTVEFSVGRRLLVGLLGTCLFSSLATASWMATGPFGGDADIVRVIGQPTTPQAKGHVIAAARNGLIYSSTNGGASWTWLSFPAQFAGILHALEVDPAAPATWYAGVESEFDGVSGVYKTTDAGSSWTLLPASRGLAVWSLSIWEHDSSVIAAGTGTGVYRSGDGGASWKRISPESNEDLRPVVSLAFHPMDAKILYAGTTHLPWRTVDGGATWQSIHEGMIDDSDVFSIQVDRKNPEHVMASACSGVYNSEDGAAHWTRLETPKGAFRTHFVALDPRRDNIVFAGTTEGLLRSENGGKTWRVSSTQSVRAVSFDPLTEGRVFFAASSGGVMVSNDEGITLRESNVGFTNRNFTGLTGAGTSLYSSSVFDAGTAGVYRTENLALRWERGAGPSGDSLVQLATDPDSPRHLYGAGYHGLFESRDAGVAWSLRKGPDGSQPVTALMPLPGGVLIAGTASGIFRSTDSNSWKPVQPGKVQLFQRSGAHSLAALTTTGALSSTDDGLTWKACGEPAAKASWYGLAFDSANPLVGLAATSSGLFRSTDGCTTWVPVLAGLDAATVGLVIFHPTHAREAFASQAGRVLVSTDGGQRWQPIDEDSGGNAGPSSLFVLSAFPDRLFALFPRRGVYSTSIGIWNSARTDTMSTVAFRPRND